MHDDNLERILDGRPELAHTLPQVEQEATRRAVATEVPQIVCMGVGAELCIRTPEDYKDEEDTLTSLVLCHINGTRQNIEQE